MTPKVRQAVIMVGGKGTRLRPLTDNCPKPILPVLDKPCLEYFIDSIAKEGITDVILACGYKSEYMTSAIGDGSRQGISITYSYEDHPMGTAGAVKLLEDRLDDVFIAVNGDVFIDIDVGKEIRDHFEHDASVTIALTTVSDPTQFGIVGLDDDGRITRFKEKPKKEEAFSNLINAGVYVFNKDVLRFVPKGEPFDLSKDLFPILLENGYRLQGHRMDGHWRDVGRPYDLFHANLETAARKESPDDSSVDSCEISGTFYSGSRSKVSACCVKDTVIHGDCIVKDSTISDSLIMSHCNIHGARIEGSILGKGCIVGKGAMLKDAVIGDGAIIPDGMSIEGTIDRTAYKRKAVFIDRDDTINDDVGHCSRPEDIRLLPGVSNAIASLNRSGFLVIMVTNQSVIGRGMVDEKGLDAIHDKLREDLLATGGGVIDDIFYCPHLPDAGCDCRKPKPMLGLKAIEKYGIDPRYSFMVGDSDKDIEFGRNIGVKPIKVDGDYTFVDAVNDIIDV